jgi:hypothetical protein
MGKTLIILLGLIAFLLSCGTTKSTDFDKPEGLANVKLLEVKRFNSVNQIKCIKENMDTIFLISRNKREYQIDSSKFITLRLTQVTRFRVGTMEQLGAYLVSGNDTLWSGRTIENAPKFYWIVED